MEKVSMTKVVCLVVLCMVVVLQHGAEGLTCGDVENALLPCLGYIRGAPTVGSGCCPGVKHLFGLAKTPVDRRTACGCMKNAATAIKPFSLTNAQSLPKICGVSIPYRISPDTDCAKVN